MTHDCTFLEDLGLGDSQISFAEANLEAHAADWMVRRRGGAVTPDAVVYPETTEDVSAVLAAATDNGVPVTPYAAGTGLEGNAVPVHRGISLDLTRMDGVYDYRREDFQIDVGPGILGSKVDEHVAGDGLFFPPLPSSADISTIGGMIATDASGMKTVKYGEIRDWVLRVEAVLSDGSVIEAGSRASKTSSGYNLKDLLVGSEGTLGVITEATLELAGRPEQIRGGRAIFSTLEDATRAISDAVRTGVDATTIELVDAMSAKIANRYLETDLPDSPMVFLEFHANHGIDVEIELCRTIFESHGVVDFEMSQDEYDMADLWRARWELPYAIENYDPDRVSIHPGDVTVPIRFYPDIVKFAKDLEEESGLAIPCFGHGGDGNLHYTVLVDHDDPEEVELGRELYDRIVRKAIELDGTATGEQGIGREKQGYLEVEHGENAVRAMRAIKHALDPTDTLNPGKIFPETVDGGRVEFDE